MPAEADEILLELGPARDQGQRPTCLSFAISDAHRRALDLSELLSPESLHRAASARSGRGFDQAISEVAGLTALKLDGQTTEASWPYNQSSCIDREAVFHRRIGRSAAFEPDKVVVSLIARKPVVTIIDIGEEFFTCRAGMVLRPPDIRPVEGRHAVVVSGTRVENGEQVFRLKNSWGSSWGDTGHIWASIDYIYNRAPSVMWID